MLMRKPGVAPRIPDGYLTVEDALGITADPKSPFILEHIASRRNQVRIRCVSQGMALERVARSLDVPESVIEQDIDWLAERGLI
ncbi:hypothetical protein ABT084_13675 [Streptomyces sp. NPDC002138]|uniref:hypothetical protein n=1 Tax=Streptomyces sp. NPDC002138 TaxID=3154410 RepID=UPI0033166836